MSERIPDETIAEWRQTCESATPGPWWCNGLTMIADDIPLWDESPDNGAIVISVDDSAFISTARLAMPLLLIELTTLRAERDALRAVVDAARAYRASFGDWTAAREGHAKLVLYATLDALSTPPTEESRDE